MRASPLRGVSLLLATVLGLGAPGPRAGAAYPVPDSLFADSMEVGDLEIWRRIETAGGGTVELSTAVRHSGRYAARFAVPAGEGQRHARLLGQYTWCPRFAEAKTFALRAYLYFADDFRVAAEGTVPVLAFGSYKAPPDGAYEGNMVEVAVRRGPGGLVLCVPGAAGSPTGTTPLATGMWHCVETQLVPGDDGKAEMTVMLNGKREFAAAGLSVPGRPDGIAVGLSACDSPESGGSMLVDDVVVAEKPVGPQNVAVQLAHPNFAPRVGAPVVAILTGDRADDRLMASLTSKAGLDRTVLDRKGPFGGRADFRVDLGGLPASTYTLTVRLLDAAGQQRAAATYTYDKLHDGDLEYSIDASNAIVHRGKKFFPVTSFGLRRTEVAEWKAKRYCNLLYGKEWGTELVGVPKYKRLLDVAADNGMACIGPAADDRFDRQGLPQWTPEAVKEYLTQLGDHPGVAWWMWREEPVNWKYDAASQKLWWDLSCRLDPRHMTEILHMGACYQIGILRAKAAYMIWPWLTGDVYSWDIYPIENEHENRGTFVDYAQAADRAVNWNMGLVPVIVNVATADVTPGKKGGTPTPEEIAFVCWLSIVHQAKGVHWYPYQGKVPPENYEAMTKFVDDTAALTEAILGDESPIPVADKELGGGRVDVRATVDSEGNLTIVAVNLGRKGEKATFTLGRRPDGKPLPEGLRVEVYGEKRTIALEGSTFTDAFAPIGVHIYRLAGAAR